MTTAPDEDPRLRLAYDEGLRVILQQRDDLERLRTRVVTLASAATVAAGLLGGFFGDTQPQRNGWFYLGLAGLGVLVACVCYILAPHETIFENDPRIIVQDYYIAERDRNDMLRHLAEFSGVNADTNKTLLDRLSKAYLVAVTALGGLVIGFALSLVTGGSSDARPTTPATQQPTTTP